MAETYDWSNDRCVSCNLYLLLRYAACCLDVFMYVCVCVCVCVRARVRVREFMYACVYVSATFLSKLIYFKQFI
jgi:hypothetical protein